MAAQLSDDLWLTIHDWTHNPWALVALGRRWLTLFRYRCVRCRLDGAMAVHRCLRIAPWVRDLRVERAGADGILSLRLLAPAPRLEVLNIQCFDTTCGVHLGPEDLRALQRVIADAPVQVPPHLSAT